MHVREALDNSSRLNAVSHVVRNNSTAEESVHRIPKCQGTLNTEMHSTPPHSTSMNGTALDVKRWFLFYCSDLNSEQ